MKRQIGKEIMDTRLKIAILICICLCWQRADCAKKLVKASVRINIWPVDFSCPITDLLLIGSKDKLSQSKLEDMTLRQYNYFLNQDLNEGAGGIIKTSLFPK